VGYNNDLVGPTVVADGAWHHIAVTYDGAVLSLYVDGRLDASSAKALNTSNIATYPLVIGRQSFPDGSNYQYANALIDEVQVLRVALNAQQVAKAAAGWCRRTRPATPRTAGTLGGGLGRETDAGAGGGGAPSTAPHRFTAAG